MPLSLNKRYVQNKKIGSTSLGRQLKGGKSVGRPQTMTQQNFDSIESGGPKRNAWDESTLPESKFFDKSIDKDFLRRKSREQRATASGLAAGGLGGGGGYPPVSM